MKRTLALLFIITGLIFTANQSLGQLMTLGAGKGAPGGGGGFTPSCTESTNFLTRATTVTLTADKTNYNALICGLVTDSIFSKLDALYIWAAPDRTSAKLNLIQSNYPVTETNYVANFTPYVGYTGDGTFLLASGFQANIAVSPKYVQDSASFGVYNLSNITSGGSDLWDVYADTSANANFTGYYFGNAVWVINANTNKNVANTSTLGQWIITRTSSTASALYKNGSSSAFDTDTQLSVLVPFDPFGFFVGTVAQMSAGFIGGALSSSDQVALAARINTFMTAYGINVY